MFERHASQRRKSESDVLDSGLGEHEVTFTTDLVRGGKTTETSANGGYHTEEWYVRGRGPSTEEGYQEVQVEQQAIYSEVRKSNKVTRSGCTTDKCLDSVLWYFNLAKQILGTCP